MLLAVTLPEAYPGEPLYGVIAAQLCSAEHPRTLAAAGTTLGPFVQSLTQNCSPPAEKDALPASATACGMSVLISEHEVVRYASSLEIILAPSTFLHDLSRHLHFNEVDRDVSVGLFRAALVLQYLAESSEIRSNYRDAIVPDAVI